MRQRLIIVITLLVVIVILVGLNAASYVRVEHVSDSEDHPDRSTFNSGATGTQALFDFLHESGFTVVRWRDAPVSLLSVKGPKPSTLVIIGRTQVPYTRRERIEILHWVESGGRLVVIDRTPDRWLLPKSGPWSVSVDTLHSPWSALDANDAQQMTNGVKPISPSQPTALAYKVGSVLPSQFAGRIHLTRSRSESQHSGDAESEPTPMDQDTDESDSDYDDTPLPPPSTEETSEKNSPAPVVHVSQESGGLLVDYPHGKGRIVLLSDPYIVANNGIGRADNVLLAMNVIGGEGGLIAFDEFHQGRATTHNALIQYFSGTPVIALCAQFALLGLAIVWSRGRRFARPLPLPHVDRLSKLEFVASMAELQQRARAHDLALENIYGRVRRVLVRHAGLSNSSARAEIAKRVAMRSGINRDELETLMRNCEDTINGAPTNARESLRMVKKLREIESMLGLRTRSRDARQASEKN